MNEVLDTPHREDLPEPNRKPPRKTRFPIVWIVPILAILAGMALLVRSFIDHGPTITISFNNAEGLEAGKTDVKYKNVIVGKVSHIALTEDHAQVIITVELTRNASELAVADTKFWVERPRIGVGGVSGIGTLLSGPFIGVDIGVSHEKQKRFVGLEQPPAFLHDQRGRVFVLTGQDPGSLTSGSPVFYRRIEVGAVSSTALTPDGKSAELHVFVEAPYDRFVTTTTRFWNSSGLDLTVNAQGLKLNTESLATVIAGGVTFQVVDESDPGTAAPDGAKFPLYEDRVTAFAPPDKDPIPARMSFDDNTRGLVVGSTIEFRGVTIGNVSTVALSLDPQTQVFHTDVVANLYPQRMGPAYTTLMELAKQRGVTLMQIIQQMVDERGLHAQLRTGNMFIGQVYVALDFFKISAVKPHPRDGGVIWIATEPGTIDAIEKQIESIVKKLDSIPFDEIGKNLNGTLASASSVMAQIDKDIAPEARKIFHDAQVAIQSLKDNVAAPDSELQSNARATLGQMQRAAYSLRVLSDYLEQHPEALLRGKSITSEPVPTRQGSAH